MRLIFFLCWCVLSASLLQAKPIQVKAELVEITPVPKLKDIDTYSRALSVYEYKVKGASDHFVKDQRIYVLKWSIWQRRVVDNLPVKIGEQVNLEIDVLSDYKQFANDRIIGEVVDKDRVLYWDLGSLPKANNLRKLDTGVTLSRKGIKKNWLFLNDDVRHLNSGEFWKKWAVGGKVDTLDVILDFKKRLQHKGVELLLVPVPTKTSIYTDYLVGEGFRIEQNGYIDVLKNHGVEVLDLRRAFLKKRQDSNRLLYCRTDSHWAPEGASLAAEEISNILKKKAWFADVEKRKWELSLSGLIEIKGDLLDPKVKAEQLETLPIEYVDAGGKSIASEQPDSPITLVGDSHTLVFSDEKAFHADGAGLPDYLAFHSGVAVDLVASFGSGMNSARGALYRNKVLKNPDYWKNKKLVIWCFSERELSKSEGLSIKVPVSK